jgi:hypothetical protein
MNLDIFLSSNDKKFQVQMIDSKSFLASIAEYSEDLVTWR